MLTLAAAQTAIFPPLLSMRIWRNHEPKCLQSGDDRPHEQKIMSRHILAVGQHGAPQWLRRHSGDMRQLAGLVASLPAYLNTHASWQILIH